MKTFEKLSTLIYSFKNTKSFELFSQYDANILGGHGGGGEYVTQLGFGWSNGVVMDLLAQYGKELTSTGPL